MEMFPSLLRVLASSGEGFVVERGRGVRVVCREEEDPYEKSSKSFANTYVCQRTGSFTRTDKKYHNTAVEQSFLECWLGS